MRHAASYGPATAPGGTPCFPVESSTVPPTFEAFRAEHNIPADHPNLDGWQAVWRREQEVAAFAPTVIPPCPAWCNLPAGHDYDSTDGSGDELTYQRRHVAFEGDKLADVSATEGNCFGTVTVELPYVYLSLVDGNGDESSVEQVRALAAELLQAAAVLDRITR